MKKLLVITVIALTFMFIGLNFSSIDYNIIKTNSPNVTYSLTFQESGIPVNRPFSIYLYNETTGYYNNTTVISTGYSNLVSLVFSNLIAENYSWEAKNISTYKPNVKSGQIDVETNTFANQLTYTLYTPYKLIINAYNKPNNIETVGSINTSLNNGLINVNAFNSNTNWISNQSFSNQMTFDVGNLTYYYNIWTKYSDYAINSPNGSFTINGKNLIINQSYYLVSIKINNTVSPQLYGVRSLSTSYNGLYNKLYNNYNNPMFLNIGTMENLYNIFQISTDGSGYTLINNFVLPNGYFWFNSSAPSGAYYEFYYISPSITKTYNVNFTENLSSTYLYVNGNTQSHNYYNEQLQNGTYNFTYAIQSVGSTYTNVDIGNIIFTVSGFSESIYVKYYYLNLNESIFHANIYLSSLKDKGKLASAVQYTNITAYMRNFTYILTVNELGLPNTLQWTAIFNGISKSTSNTNLEFNTRYGTFPLNISNVNNYAPNKITQNVSILGNTIVNITFSEGFTYQFIPNIVSQYYLTIINSSNYKIIYTADSGNSISILLKTGKYQYYANSSGYYELNGSISVQQSLSLNLNFVLIKVRYQYNFIPNIVDQYYFTIINGSNDKTVYTQTSGNVISLMLLRTETYQYYANATGYKELSGTFTVSKDTNFSLKFITNTAYKVTSYFNVQNVAKAIVGTYYIYYSNGSLLKQVSLNYQSFITNYLVNGTYIINAYTNAYYINNNSPNVITINGSNEYSNISMITYSNYVFYEYGLPANTNWKINVNGTVYQSFNDIIKFRLPDNFNSIPIQIENVTGFNNNFTIKNLTPNASTYYVKFTVNTQSQYYIMSFFMQYEIYIALVIMISSIGLIALVVKRRGI